MTKTECVEYGELFPEAQVLGTCGSETMRSHHTQQGGEGRPADSWAFFCCASPAHFTNSLHIAFLSDSMAYTQNIFDLNNKTLPL